MGKISYKVLIKKMKKIILATDFSPVALNAANYAAELATAIKADLLLVHTYFLIETYSIVPSIVTAGELEYDVNMSMDELKKELVKKHSSLNIKTVVRRGTLINELKQLCEEIKPFCIVMGSQGASATDYRLFGSQTVNAMKDIHWPVIAVPGTATFSNFKNIGIACDLEYGIDHIPSEDIKSITSEFHASLHILNASSGKAGKTKIIEEASVLMDELSPMHHQFHFINEENDDKGIMDLVEKINIDLLIVLPKKHTLFEKWMNKSHTRKIVLNLNVPVMGLHFAK